MKTTKRPWGRISMMLVASYVTLIGLWFGLDPEVILLRASLAALVAGCAARAMLDIAPRQQEMD